VNTLVLALGNPLRGDDGIGAAVLDTLECYQLPPDVTLLDGGTAGLETVLTLQGFERAVIIDAADMDMSPGTWLRFTPEAVRLYTGNLALRGTLHYAGLAESLSLGSALNMLPSEIIIFGVQPAEISWIPGLSAEIAAVIPEVRQAVLSAVIAPYTCVVDDV
jgi:hydrogenase maturation protease